MSTAADDLRARVAKVLREEIGPGLHLDRGEFEVLDVRDGVVQVRLGSVCTGCPSTLMAVIHGLEVELHRHFPEIEYLEAVP